MQSMESIMDFIGDFVPQKELIKCWNSGKPIQIDDTNTSYPVYRDM